MSLCQLWFTPSSRGLIVHTSICLRQPLATTYWFTVHAALIQVLWQQMSFSKMDKCVSLRVPPIFILWVLGKIKSCCCLIILIAPFWPCQPWLLEFCCKIQRHYIWRAGYYQAVFTSSRLFGKCSTQCCQKLLTFNMTSI